MRPGSLRLSQADLCVLRVRETADRTHLILEEHGRTSHSISGCDETILYRLWNQHQAAGDIASSKDVRRRSAKVSINLYITSHVGGNTRRREVQTGSVGHPPDCHDCQRSLGAFTLTVFPENHSHTSRYLLEGFNGTEIFSHR